MFNAISLVLTHSLFNKSRR